MTASLQGARAISSIRFSPILGISPQEWSSPQIHVKRRFSQGAVLGYAATPSHFSISSTVLLEYSESQASRRMLVAPSRIFRIVSTWLRLNFRGDPGTFPCFHPHLRHPLDGLEYLSSHSGREHYRRLPEEGLGATAVGLQLSDPLGLLLGQRSDLHTRVQHFEVLLLA